MQEGERFAGTSSDARDEAKRAPARALDASLAAASAIGAAAGAARVDVWQSAAPLLRSRFGESNFIRWLDPLLVRREAGGIALEVEDRARERALRQHFLPGICEALREIGFSGEVSLRTAAPATGTPAAAPRSESAQTLAATGVVAGPPPLDRRYTFDRFVVGESNRFAHDAARIVAESPGRVHNPLYLHGGVGLGKTHLAIAIAHAVAGSRGTGATVTMSADAFLDRVDDARRHGADSLDRLAADAAIVVFDDVQLLTRDEDVLAELFRWLDMLLARRCQIVLTCDLSPPAIRPLSVGLKSRWESGFAAEILPPDLALRREIVRRQAAAAAAEIADDVVDFIAATEEGSVRALEGAFNRVRELAASTSRELTLALARQALADRRAQPQGPPDLDAIADAVAASFGLTARALRARKRRDRDASLARQVAVHLARQLSGLPLAEIAADLGFRDHSVAAHACAALRDRLAGDPALAERLRVLAERLAAVPDAAPRGR